MTASETKRNRRSDELPWLSNYAPWKECFYDKVRQRCRSLQETKVKMIRAQRAEEEKVKKREPCDWLAKEWLSDEKQSLDTRIYLLDKLLPTVITGMEKLSMKVERKGVLVPDKEPAQFNPINFLGEYLMRHNPQHGASAKPGPYLRALKMVTEELKSEMPGTISERWVSWKCGWSQDQSWYRGLSLTEEMVWLQPGWPSVKLTDPRGVQGCQGWSLSVLKAQEAGQMPELVTQNETLVLPV